MRPIRVVPVGEVERDLAGAVCAALAHELRTRCHIAAPVPNAAFAHHPERNQYHSTAILEHLARFNGDGIVVGVTALDLYIPILTFVFGEAQLGGTCAVVSSHRLTQEFYGLPADRALLRERLAKVAIHEAGHTSGLTHCDDYDCVMAASHSVEWLDLKGAAMCCECRKSV